jgi:hypothetical protein
MSKLEELENRVVDEDETDSESEEEEEEQVAARPNFLQQAVDRVRELNLAPKVSKAVSKGWRLGGKISWSVMTTMYVVVLPLMVINAIAAAEDSSRAAADTHTEAY